MDTCEIEYIWCVVSKDEDCTELEIVLNPDYEKLSDNYLSVLFSAESHTECVEWLKTNPEWLH